MFWSTPVTWLLHNIGMHQLLPPNQRKSVEFPPFHLIIL